MSIPTPATDHAPRGRVIDDSARGTIFWEANHGTESEVESGAIQASDSTADNTTTSAEQNAAGQDWGKPFRIAWQSSNRLPFYRTRGLRNPWNANREVKIARDGIELEPSVGRRLVDMFHRPAGGGGGAVSTAAGPSHWQPHVQTQAQPQPPAVVVGTMQGSARQSGPYSPHPAGPGHEYSMLHGRPAYGGS